MPLVETGGLLETTQSTDAASVVTPIPGPHQTSGTPTQLDDNANDNDDWVDGLALLMLLFVTVTAAELILLGSLVFLLFIFFFFSFSESQLAEVLMTAGTETCEEAAQPSPLNVEDVKFFFLEVVMAVVVLMRLSLVVV